MRLKQSIISILPMFIITITYLFNEFYYVSICIKYINLLIVFICSFLLITFKFKNQLFYKILLLIAYFSSFGMACYIFLYNYDLLKYFTSITAIKELIKSTGTAGNLIFILVQIAQVVFLPIPAVALIVVGIVVYGAWKTAIYCSLGVVIGSYISFLIGKTFGFKFVSWVIGDKKVVKFSNLLKNNGKYILGFVFIFPFFPDDLFCMVAGISPMTFKEFFIITTIIRPISVTIMCLFGGGAILSINTISGIIILVLSIIVFLVIIFIVLRQNKKIVTLLLKKRLH